jgi:hypothetical protein
MRVLTSIIFAIISLQSLAAEIPDGIYSLVAVRCGTEQQLKQSQQVKFNKVTFNMIQASVPERDSLSRYWWGARIEKNDKILVFHWSQLHEGNATEDERNHAPFYATFTTSGTIRDNYLEDMHLLTNSTEIYYLKRNFNHQTFTPEDITGRLAKSKHVGSYSTRISWKKLKDTDKNHHTLYEFNELDKGFGAPRHLLCGHVENHMSFIVRAIS